MKATSNNFVKTTPRNDNANLGIVRGLTPREGGGGINNLRATRQQLKTSFK